MRTLLWLLIMLFVVGFFAYLGYVIRQGGQRSLPPPESKGDEQPPNVEEQP